MRGNSWFATVILVPIAILPYVAVCYVPSLSSRMRQSSSLCAAANFSRNRSEKDKQSALLNEFRIASGELIDPYRVLKVDRDSTKAQIKKAYHKMSRKYHPDQVRYADMLPGKCDNLDEVREEWERVNLSYVILSDKRTRQRYDRNSNLADPGAALTRAAIGTVSWGFSNLAKGIFKASSMAMDTLATPTSTETDEHEEDSNRPAP